MRLAFLSFLISFFQFVNGEPLNRDALKACARHLVRETTRSRLDYMDWDFLAADLSQDLEATVLVRLDASLVPPKLMQTDFRYSGIMSPNELTYVDAGHRTVFFVVHGSGENLASLAQDLKKKFPSGSLSYRILLSRPQPFPNSPPFFRAEGLSLALAEAIESCFFSVCVADGAQSAPVNSTVTENYPSDLTIVNKQTRDNMIAFLRAHASSAEIARTDIGKDFGLLKLIKDFMVQASSLTEVKIDKALAKTEPKKSDGTGFRGNNPRAVERILAAWVLMLKSVDESLLAEPLSEKTLTALDQVYQEQKARRTTKGKRKV